MKGQVIIPLTHYVGARGAAYSRKFYHVKADMIVCNENNKTIDTLVGYRWGKQLRRGK